ncbi:MAG: hypothetical protein H6672_07945 [Anaerolineaceae bacterium]|nr:hypothetical protein [Anaerolineaceae bacterium]
MVVNQTLESVNADRTRELIFAGDGVRLAGQVDYPSVPTGKQTFPLVFLLHHAGCVNRRGYEHYAQMGMDAGYAVFRWDKRGTGRSGAGGRGSTIQDAVNAYEIALEQPGINRRKVVIVAQGAGTGILGSAYGLFARVQQPYGVVLVTNMLDETAVQAIDTQIQIVMGQNDWNPWQKYGQAACDAHLAHCKHGASFYVAPEADRMLIDSRTETFHAGARRVIQEWLESI